MTIMVACIVKGYEAPETVAERFRDDDRRCAIGQGSRRDHGNGEGDKDLGVRNPTLGPNGEA
jgi:hypothetical protein